MMPISPEPLSPNALSHLQTLQNQVDNEPDMEAKYKCAAQLWQTRKNRIPNRANWDEIEQKLKNGGPRPGLCHYCEFDRIAATEHICPKKHFPDRSFQYANYLLACYRCNSINKGDKFAVFSPPGSNSWVNLIQSRGSYLLPPTDDAVLINPRIENPNDFLELDLMTGKLVPKPSTEIRNVEKAKYTIDLLGLNSDDNLLRYRLKAIKGYQDHLERYTKVKTAVDFPSLLDSLSLREKQIVVQSRSFQEEQTRLLLKIKTEILDDLFPFAWCEIIAKKHSFQHIHTLLEAAPEVETW
jgi:uncharacterized protein (TIGR02646 family)